jgi:hypothetical protein
VVGRPSIFFFLRETRAAASLQVLRGEDDAPTRSVNDTRDVPSDADAVTQSLIIANLLLDFLSELTRH